jgi:L-fucose isomerase-like protein
MEKIKAGYVSFGTMFYEPNNLKIISAKAEKQLEDAGISLHKTAPVFGEDAEPIRAIKELKNAEWDFLIVNIINWVDTRGVFRVLHEFKNYPMILYSFGGWTDENGTLISPAAGAGSTSIRYPLEQWGFKFKYLFNGPDLPMDTDGIISFARAVIAVKKLKNARLGMIGFNDMGLYTTGINTTKLRGEIGPEVESVDLLQVKSIMNKLSDDYVKKETVKITKNWEYPAGEIDNSIIEKTVRMYLATKQICEEKNFAGMSYKCVEGVDQELGLMHAIPASLLASNGIPYVDENDLGNLVAELMFRWISEQQVMFIEHYEHHPDWILLGEDGYIADDFIDGKPQIKELDTGNFKGITHCSNMKKGRVTLACLSEDREGYRMHIVSGEAKERPEWVEMGVPLPPWPSIKFYPDSSVRSILDHVQSQHFAMVYGDYVEELKNICYLLDIKPVLDV